MTGYVIQVVGCDESTSVVMNLAEGEAELVRLVAEAITKASEYGCMPTMSIRQDTSDPSSGGDT